MGNLPAECTCYALFKVYGGTSSSAVCRLPGGYHGAVGSLRGGNDVVLNLCKTPPGPILESDTLDIDIGVAQGEWIAAGEVENKPDSAGTVLKLDGRDTVVLDGVSGMRYVFDNGYTTVLAGTPSSVDYEFKAEFVTHDGRVLQNWNGTPKHCRRETPERFTLIPVVQAPERLRPEDIASYRLFYRRYEFARFAHVALRPRVGAAGSGRGGPEEGEAEGVIWPVLSGLGRP
ncbi:MAG: hypothetical protein IH624_08180 [Phycisphaerae bacterium]|nr:hypothetical protein [Phycisphaerae bacterium]